MIRSIVFPRVLGKSLDDLQPALTLLQALGFAGGNEWHEGGSHGIEMLAPRGGFELIAAPDAPGVEAMVEVSDADLAYQIVKKIVPTLSPKAGDTGGASGVSIRKEIGDTPYGARLFEIEISGMRLGFITYAKKADAAGIEGALDATGKRFAIIVARFNSFITERLLDGALLALRQCRADPKDIAIVHVPGAFEIPGAARQLAQSKDYNAIVCLGCVIRGDTLHYEVIANEVTRGVGQSAQETGVPHGFGVLTCDTLEQAIDRAGLKSGNKGYEAALAAVEMACLREKVTVRSTAAMKTAP
ncbi:MAG: 6,7-dimethyl-8-ribityllumazine synthase [Candidatus Korobacteraceae bacterium]